MAMAWACLVCSLSAAQTALPVQWADDLFRAPKAFPAPEAYDVEGVTSVMLEGPEYQGQATRVFAYYGLPPVAEGEKVPGMVLIHGGGGTAFARWARLWIDRGYAAIAMDTCGCFPDPVDNKHPRHEQGGPPGWGGFTEAMAPPTEQWPYHAVAAAVLSHSFLRSLPAVDADRIGLTGISWGGYLTCMTAAADPRYQFAVPVYGCGFLGENSAWSETLAELGDTGTRWLDLWDPKHYLPHVKAPMLWVTGTNDFAYPLDALRRSYGLPQSAQSLCVRLRMPHGHGAAGENPGEIHAFADHLLKGGAPLPTIRASGTEAGKVWAQYTSATPLASAELLYTKDTGKWQDRLWETAPATLLAGENKAVADLPAEATVYYLNLIDANGLAISSPHEDRHP